MGQPLHWMGICRLGLVQAALGSVVVLVTSTLNRVMVVEYALPAILPGLLVALHYGVQMIRPRFGHGSDVGGRRTPWIIGGVLVLGVGGTLCAVATVMLPVSLAGGLALAAIAYALVGLGVGAAGTSLLVLMGQRVAAGRRAAAATIMWVLMIAGFAVTSRTAAHFLDPYSPHRLVLVVATAAAIACIVAILAVWNVETGAAAAAAPLPRTARGSTAEPLREALRGVWREPESRRFTLFVFTSMLAYSAQELILEPFAGLVFRYSLGQSANLSSLLHQGVLVGMICVGLACSGARRFGGLRNWTIGGCVGSALAMLVMIGACVAGPAWPLHACVLLLGFANGVFAVAAIGSMMELAHANGDGRAGLRMGLWGAAQAVAFAFGGLFGSSIVDAVRLLSGSTYLAYGVVFAAEAALFLVAAAFAAQLASRKRQAFHEQLASNF
jgi:BCD family chlorophyll transporter-like MFS transporter